MKIPKKKRKELERVLSIAADIGQLTMSLRDKPTRLDWVSVGMRAVALGAKIHGERRAASTKDPWRYFDGDGIDCPWVAVPEALAKLFLKYVRDVELVEEYWDEDPSSDRVLRGNIGGETLAWIADRDYRVEDGPYVEESRVKETYAALGGCIWSDQGTESLLFGKDGLIPDPFVDKVEMQTEQFRDLASRTRAFLRAGLTRSYLFSGPPGTGKSTGMRQLARSLDLRTLRVDIKILRSQHGAHEVTASVDTLFRTLAPDALILDDIDRALQGESLLHFFELANRECKLVMASANSMSDMCDALIRPGRFDEIIDVSRPDPRVISMLLGKDADLAEELCEMPLAYIVEFVKRRDALGRGEALRELPALRERLNSQKDDDEAES